jgi:hypothetical protein
MMEHNIVINPQYQRSSKVWPPAARSYLIDTILHGYPMPKISLYQKTDLKSRKTLKEIVDGQQRSQAIVDFYNDKLRISGKSDFTGRKYSQLDEPDQQSFMGYPVSADVFVGASDPDIRQVFRRINSYTVPLNPQEKRHAIYQGAFKWFIVEQSELYAQCMKDVGIFAESQLSRMNDATLMGEICLALLEGIQSASETKLDNLYRQFEDQFPKKAYLSKSVKTVMSQMVEWKEIHRGSLMKPYNFYTLALAIVHSSCPVPCLKLDFALESPITIDREIVIANLTTLADALDEPSRYAGLKDFIDACSKATNRISQRKTRFSQFCRALQPRLFE